MKISYQLQLILAFTALLLTGGTAATFFLSRWVASELEDVVIRQTSSLAGNLANWCEDAVLTERRLELRQRLLEVQASNEDVVYVFIHDRQEQVLAHSFEGAFPEQLGTATVGRERTLLSTERGSVLDLEAPILDGVSGAVHVGYSRRRVLASVDRVRAVVWFIAAPIFVLGILAVWIVSGRLTRPASSLTRAARRLGAGDMGARVEERFRGEFGELVEAFNAMAASLERQAKELRFLTEYNQNLIDNLGAGLYVIDGDQRITYANREIVREVGPVEGRKCHEALCQVQVPCTDCVNVLAAEQGSVMTRTCSRPDGRWLEHTAIPIRSADGAAATILTRRDVTEAVRMQERITRQEKLAAIGELSAVVAHEVSNPLDGMHSLVRLVRDDPETPAGSRRHLEMVDNGLSRMEMIVRRLLTFTRDEATPTLVATLRDQVDRALVFVRTPLESAGVATVFRFEDDGTRVRVDPNRFPQVLVNLALNAADAMPDGGTLTVHSVRCDGGVRLTFEDEGHGVPPDIRERIFQPFFTTKDSGSGTGLGLAVSRRIVEGHEGTLTCRPAPAGGAAFDLWLPIAGGEDISDED